MGVLKTSAVYGDVFTPTQNKELRARPGRVSCPGSRVTGREQDEFAAAPRWVAAAVRQGPAQPLLPDRLWAVTFSGAEPRFIDWWTKTTANRAQVEAVCVGTSSSDANISQGDILAIRIELAGSRKQRAIADYLDRETARIDTLIEEQERLIEMLLERRHSLVDGAFGAQSANSRLQNACIDVVDCPHTTPEVSDNGGYEAVRTASVRDGKFRPGNGLPVDRATGRTATRVGHQRLATFCSRARHLPARHAWCPTIRSA